MPNYRITPAAAPQGDIVAGDASMRGTDRVLLGRLVESGPRRNLWLDTSGEQVVAVLGKRGTGKSYSLGVLLEALAAGSGSTPIAQLNTPRSALVLDIMDIFWTTRLQLVQNGPTLVVEQYNAMRSFGLQSPALNVDVWVPAGYERPVLDLTGTRTLFIRAADLELDDWGALFGVDIFGEPRGMLIADVVQRVGAQGYARANGMRIPANPNFNFTQLLDCLRDDASLAQDYRDDTIRSIRQRMNTYASLPLFSGAATPLSDLLQPFRAAVLMLARVPDDLKKVIVAVLLRRILRERRDASTAQKRLHLDAALTAAETQELEDLIRGSIPRCWILMDEAHTLAGADEPSVARDALIDYAKLGRNYGLSLAVATQQPSALDPRLMSQVETMLVHQLTAPGDARVAAANNRSPLPQEIQVDGTTTDLDGLLRRLGQGEALFSCANAPQLARPCVVGVRPRVSAHGGYEA